MMHNQDVGASCLTQPVSGGNVSIHIGLLVFIAGTEGPRQGIDDDQDWTLFEGKYGLDHRIQVITGQGHAMWNQLEGRLGKVTATGTTPTDRTPAKAVGSLGGEVDHQTLFNGLAVPRDASGDTH